MKTAVQTRTRNKLWCHLEIGLSKEFLRFNLIIRSLLRFPLFFFPLTLWSINAFITFGFFPKVHHQTFVCELYCDHNCFCTHTQVSTLPTHKFIEFLAVFAKGFFFWIMIVIYTSKFSPAHNLYQLSQICNAIEYIVQHALSLCRFLSYTRIIINMHSLI